MKCGFLFSYACFILLSFKRRKNPSRTQTNTYDALCSRSQIADATYIILHTFICLCIALPIYTHNNTNIYNTQSRFNQSTARYFKKINYIHNKAILYEYMDISSTRTPVKYMLKYFRNHRICKRGIKRIINKTIPYLMFHERKYKRSYIANIDVVFIFYLYVVWCFYDNELNQKLSFKIYNIWIYMCIYVAAYASSYQTICVCCISGKYVFVNFTIYQMPFRQLLL